MDIEQFKNIDLTITVILNLFLVYTAFRNIEFFFIAGEFKKHGVLSWEILKLRNNNIVRRLFRFVECLCTAKAFFAMLALSSLCSVAIMLNLGNIPVWILFLPVFISNLVIVFRNSITFDGADSLINIINATLAIIVFNMDSLLIKQASLVFIAIQTLLSYFFSGAAKFRSKAWMQGDALYHVLNTNLFGHAGFATLLKRSGTTTSKIITVGISSWQVVFPFSLLLPLNFFILVIITGLIFHLLNAVAMGLGRFFLAYLCAYPAVIFLKLFCF